MKLNLVLKILFVLLCILTIGISVVISNEKLKPYNLNSIVQIIFMFLIVGLIFISSAECRWIEIYVLGILGLLITLFGIAIFPEYKVLNLVKQWEETANTEINPDYLKHSKVPPDMTKMNNDFNAQQKNDLRKIDNEITAAFEDKSYLNSILLIINGLVLMYYSITTLNKKFHFKSIIRKLV